MEPTSEKDKCLSDKHSWTWQKQGRQEDSLVSEIKFLEIDAHCFMR